MPDIKFRIQGRDYPYPSLHDELLLHEAVIVNQVTGCTLEEIVQQANETYLVGMAAVALSRDNPDWKAERVVQAIRQLRTGDIEVVVDDTGEPEQLPPANAPDATSAPGGTSTPSEPSASADESGRPPAASSE